MVGITFDKIGINPELLNETLKASFPGVVLGISTGHEKVIVYVLENLEPSQEAQISQVINNHDHTKKSTRQSENEAQEAILQQGRLDNSTTFDPQTITLQELASRVKWLEEEIRSLQGLSRIGGGL